MIRQATLEDIDGIEPLCRKFYATTSYAAHTPYDEETIRELTKTLISTGIVFVADIGFLVGVIGCFVGPSMWNRNRVCSTEVVFYVEDKYEGMGIGKDLMDAVDKKCEDIEVTTNQMVALHTSPPIVDSIYKKRGYYVSEIVYTKVI